MREWIRRRPGTRPAQWWRDDAPEPRRQVSGPPVRTPFVNVVQLYVYGLPTMFDSAPDARFESESAYLDRVGLLPEHERERLDVDAFEPVGIDTDDEPEAA